MTDLDDSIGYLQAFCELLRVTNPALEAGAAELDRRAHDVGEGEAHLAQECDGLAGDMDGLQKEAESSEAEAVKACEGLGHAAEEARTTALGELEKEAAAAQEHWTEALQQKAGTLDSAFKELQDSGWSTLGHSLEGRWADFDKWREAADEAIQGLGRLFGATATDAAHQLELAEHALLDLMHAPVFGREFWQEADARARKLEAEVPHFESAVSERCADLEHADTDLASGAGDGSTHVRAQIDLIAQKAVGVIDTQANEATQAIQQAATALDSAQLEFERSAIQADQGQAAARDLAELAGQVALAEAQFVQIQAALEAMQQ